MIAAPQPCDVLQRHRGTARPGGAWQQRPTAAPACAAHCERPSVMHHARRWCCGSYCYSSGYAAACSFRRYACQEAVAPDASASKDSRCWR